MKKILLLATVLVAFWAPKSIAYDQGYAIDYLVGEGDISGLRLAYRPYYTELTEVPWFGRLDVYWELSVNFWEFGIGVSLVSDTQFAGKDIGSHYQFEDRLGLRMEFGKAFKQSVTLRYMHYSNGGLNDNNPGMDFLNLSYAQRF